MQSETITDGTCKTSILRIERYANAVNLGSDEDIIKLSVYWQPETSTSNQNKKIHVVLNSSLLTTEPCAKLDYRKNLVF